MLSLPVFKFRHISYCSQDRNSTMQDEYLDDLSHLQFQDARLVCWSLRNPSFLVHLEARQILDLHLISLTIFIHT